MINSIYLARGYQSPAPNLNLFLYLSKNDPTNLDFSIRPDPRTIRWKTKGEGYHFEIKPLTVKELNGKDSERTTIIPRAGFAETNYVEDRGDKLLKELAGEIEKPSIEGYKVHETLAAIKPKNISFEEAASLPLVTITAWEGLFDKLNLKEKEDILIHAGAGGVGSMAIQLAKWKGADIYSTISNSKKENIVNLLGAQGINYKKTDFVEYSKNMNDGKGFSKIFDTVGGKVFYDSLRAVKPYGEVVSILNVFNSELNLQEAMMKNVSIHFVMMLLPVRGKIYEKMKHQGQILDDLRKLVEAEYVKPRIEKIFSSFTQAHSYMERNSLEGKVVVKL